MAYAIPSVNGVRYGDEIIKFMEKVPELLRITGFFKSSSMLQWYKTIFKIIKTKILRLSFQKHVLNKYIVLENISKRQ